MQCLFVWTRVRYWCVHIASHKHTVCQWVPDSLSGCVFQSAHGFLSCRVVICSSVWACCLADLATSAGKLIHCVTFTKQTNPKEGIFWRQSIPASFAQTGQQLEHILSIQLNVNCCSLWVSLRLIASISTRLYYEICGSRAAWILLIADPIVYDILEQIIKHTNYDGFGNIDYMYVDGVPKLFDFNPRPSGTLLRFGAPVLAIWFKKYAGLFDSWHEVPQTQHIEKSTVQLVVNTKDAVMLNTVFRLSISQPYPFQSQSVRLLKQIYQGPCYRRSIWHLEKLDNLDTFRRPFPSLLLRVLPVLGNWS